MQKIRKINTGRKIFVEFDNVDYWRDQSVNQD
jgi:hypothetical protein